MSNQNVFQDLLRDFVVQYRYVNMVIGFEFT